MSKIFKIFKILNIKNFHLHLLLTLYLTTVMNLSFWRYVFNHIDLSTAADYLFMATIPIFIFICLYFLLSFVIFPYVTKLILVPILVISSLSNYMMFNLGVYIDSNIVRSIFQTNQREAFDLVTLSGILWALFLGVIPAILLLVTKIQYPAVVKLLIQRILGIIICLLVVIGIAAMSYKQYAAFGRNNPQLTRLVNPSNYLYATGRYYQKQNLVNRQFKILDPNPTYTANSSDTPKVFILAIGETSRSMNFSLNGYSKLTNPKLASQEVISFQNVVSCGTVTAISVPCMFSNLPKINYNADQAAYSENLLDIFQKAGVNVLWKENDDGCKGVCNRIPTLDMVAIGHPKYCDKNVCFDEVLIDDLESYLQNITKDTVIVLHMIGSHGPTYYKRYPKEFKHFEPTCDTAEIQKCSKKSIENTYDNTIVYADHVLSSAIDILKKFPKLDSGLLYLSDHGESLGERNVYLHGVPYAIAPKEQISVPMILWRSPLMQQTDRINGDCLKNVAEHSALSQDNLFHSMLGLMKIKTPLYDQKLDFFNECVQ